MLLSALFSLLLLSLSSPSSSSSIDPKAYQVSQTADIIIQDARGGVGTSCYLSNSKFHQCFGVTESGRRSGELSCNFEVSNGRACVQESKNGMTCESTCGYGECLPCDSAGQGEVGTPPPPPPGGGGSGCSCESPCVGVVCDCGLTTCSPMNGTECVPCGGMGQLACSQCTLFILILFLFHERISFLFNF